MRNAYKVLVGHHEGKITLGRPKCRLEDDIKVDHKEIGLGGYGVDSSGSRV
jgi:hypothetical protein